MAVSVAGRAAEAARLGFVTFDSGRGKDREDTVAGRMVVSVRILARSEHGCLVRAVPGGAVLSQEIIGVRPGAGALGD